MIAKLKAARDRQRAASGRCEGRKPPSNDVLREARRLRRRSPKTGRQRSYQSIARELAELGFEVETLNPSNLGNTPWFSLPTR